MVVTQFAVLIPMNALLTSPGMRADPAQALAHIASGNVDFGLAGNILLGSIPGVLLGAHLAVRVPQGQAAEHFFWT